MAIHISHPPFIPFLTIFLSFVLFFFFTSANIIAASFSSKKSVVRLFTASSLVTNQLAILRPSGASVSFPGLC
ncbi:hypothetical protein QN277_020322 [Acacia crassicarpa]|uniref:Uncharacterized protein n=1 Tax=Acacia crassicarpa TaxID=499986 RepID=A0AAE1JJA2_9FABA|nr:hypothetical protein QN277_020322 [Acacia crassicarpa]